MIDADLNPLAVLGAMLGVDLAFARFARPASALSTSDNVVTLARGICMDLRIDARLLEDTFFSEPFVPGRT